MNAQPQKLTPRQKEVLTLLAAPPRELHVVYDPGMSWYRLRGMRHYQDGHKQKLNQELLRPFASRLIDLGYIEPVPGWEPDLTRPSWLRIPKPFQISDKGLHALTAATKKKGAPAAGTDDMQPEVGDDVEELTDAGLPIPGGMGERGKVTKVFKTGTIAVTTDFGDKVRWKRGQFFVVSRAA